MELQRNHAISDATYERAVERFGEQGVVETVSLIGYYTMISMILNTSRAPLPAGATPALRPIPVLIGAGFKVASARGAPGRRGAARARAPTARNAVAKPTPCRAP